jgi:hypothetical protein
MKKDLETGVKKNPKAEMVVGAMEVSGVGDGWLGHIQIYYTLSNFTHKLLH